MPMYRLVNMNIMKSPSLQFPYLLKKIPLNLSYAMARGKRNRGEEATPSVAKRLRSSSNSEAGQEASSTEPQNGHQKKQILLNAFDMSTVGHLSPGQWKVWLYDAIKLREVNKRDRTRKTAPPRSGT